MDETQSRKLDHVKIALSPQVDFKDYCSEVYDEIQLFHQAFPGIDFNEVDTSTSFLGYRLNAPLMITGMTGGHPSLTNVNKQLALIAEKHGIAIGVGSERAIITSSFKREVVESYRVVRDTARSVPVIGNIGLNTLNDIDVDLVVKLVEVLDADALAIHLNPAQEIIQPEGDTRFNHRLVEKVKEVIRSLNKPVIIKEVGNGLSMEVVKTFHEIGVRIFDVAGACGTNWALVEALRNPADTPRYKYGMKLSRWGIPTPISVIEARHTAKDSTIIASGGVWDGVKAVVNIALGADIAGIAKPVLKKLLEEGFESADRYIDEYIFEIKATMFLLGARRTSELRTRPVALGPMITQLLLQRGIDPYSYINTTRRGL